jgi:putative FmdB family regulatory protein
MPLYEFFCKKCGNRMEALVSIGKEKSVLCKTCGNHKLEKLVSSFGIGGGSSKLKKSSASCDTCSSSSCDSCKA